jgi:hypothetical protein
MTESKKYSKIDYSNPFNSEEPITNTDIEVKFLHEAFWRDPSMRNACKHNKVGSEFVITDLTGAFSGDEGEGTQFFFCSKKCTENFIKNELGLDKLVFDPRQSQPDRVLDQSASKEVL